MPSTPSSRGRCGVSASASGAMSHSSFSAIVISNGDGGRRAVANARRSGNGAPFASLEEFARRAVIGRPAPKALGAADAFRSLGSGRRAALWEAAAVERRRAAVQRRRQRRAAAG